MSSSSPKSLSVLKALVAASLLSMTQVGSAETFSMYIVMLSNMTQALRRL